MSRRLELHEILVSILGNSNVYFQPPASVKMLYPCVVYNIGNGEAKHADNKLYGYVDRYDVTFIFKKPNVDIIEQVLTNLPMCRVSRVYVADNLNHYAFNLYF